jgi:hypothetical protein
MTVLDVRDVIRTEEAFRTMQETLQRAGEKSRFLDMTFAEFQARPNARERIQATGWDFRNLTGTTSRCKKN